MFSNEIMYRNEELRIFFHNDMKDSPGDPDTEYIIPLTRLCHILSFYGCNQFSDERL